MMCVVGCSDEMIKEMKKEITLNHIRIYLIDSSSPSSEDILHITSILKEIYDAFSC